MPRPAARLVALPPIAALSVLSALSVLPGCSAGPPAATAGARVVQVVAAENVWGAVAAELGGVHAHVSSIVDNPNADPHSYEPVVADARRLAAAQLVVENGLGYDPWCRRVLGATGTRPVVLDVGDALGLRTGDNPHRWYDPAAVDRVAARITADLSAIDRRDAAYFAGRRTRFETVALAPVHALVAAIRARHAGTPVGASESIFAMLSPALGLDLVTPPGFLRAISEGADVAAADREAADRQIAQHRIELYVYNSQNVTPDVQAQLAEVRAEHIPTATITETLVPRTATYEAWQAAQLRGIEAALDSAPRRNR